uniref:ROK family protein n=1 Tax=Carboxylicivirga caseinilyticus TaxID=3417572 RepID=UPI003D35367F|nr:ROK family protein [Marinilabiliaceae bacterium A049]
MGYLQFDTKVAEQLEGVEKKKYIQQIRIVKTLYVDGPQTTSKLCKRLRISTPNMVAIMAEMFERNILEKKGQGKSIGGRKPDLFGLVADSFYILAVEMSIYKVSIAIFNAENNQITETEEYSVELNNKKETLDEILELINSYIDRSGLDKSGFLSVGISMPGLVDSVKGINYTYMNFGDKPVTELMEESIGCPVFVENDEGVQKLNIRTTLVSICNKISFYVTPKSPEGD